MPSEELDLLIEIKVDELFYNDIWNRLDDSNYK